MSKRASPQSPDSSSKRSKIDTNGTLQDIQAQDNDPTLAVTLDNSTSILNAYVGSLRNNLSQHNAVYTPGTLPTPPGSKAPNGGFTCTVKLPFNSPVQIASSTGSCVSKVVAKRSAARSAILALMEAGEIDSDLRPTPANPSIKHKSTHHTAGSVPPSDDGHLPPAEDVDDNPNRRVEASGSRTSAVIGARANHPHEVTRNAARAELSKKTTSVAGEEYYPYKSTPDFWTESPPLSNELHGALLTLKFGEPHSARAESCRPLLFLTSRALPGMSGGPGNPLAPTTSITIDISQFGILCKATLTPTAKFNLTASQLDNAYEYTRRLFRSILNKPLDGTLEETKYLVVPVVPQLDVSVSRTCLPTISDIAWDEISLVDGPLTTPISVNEPAILLSQIEDAVISAPTEFGRRFYATRLRDDLTPHSPDPSTPGLSLYQAAMAKDKHEYRYRDVSSILYPDQPIVEAEHVVGPKSGGVVGAISQDTKPMGKLLIPELLEKHFIKASVMRTASVLPAVMSELDDELLAAEMSERFFGGRLQTSLAREALTCPAARPFPGQGQAHYERLEMLGDTVLKLAASVDAYVSPLKTMSEGAMTHARHLLVSNKALQQSLIDSGIVPYIRKLVRRGRVFIPSGWVVETGPGQRETIPDKQNLGDKVVADVVEALIAAAFLSEGESMQAALDAMHAIHIPVSIRSFDSVNAPERHPIPAGKPLVILDYHFRHPGRGHLVLSHRNMPGRKQMFERYEFLGDAVIDYLTVKTIWTNNKDVGPAELTHMKHSRVSNAAFASWLVSSGLIYYVVDIEPDLVASLAKYIEDVKAAKVAADELIAEGTPDYEFWSNVPSHKWLGDTVEALFGAIWEDSGFDLSVVERLYGEHLGPYINRYGVPPHAHSLHPKSVMLELLAAAGCCDWRIERLGETVNDDAKVFSTQVVAHRRVVGKASAGSPDIASRRACEAAVRCFKAGELKNICTCRR